MERVLPENIDYSRVLPLSVPAIARRRRFYPQNGNQFSNLGSQEIRIQIGSPNSLLDPSMSYLECELDNTGANNCGLDLGGMATLFRSMRLEQGGRQLSFCNEFNRLHASVLTLGQTTRNGLKSDSITGGGRSNNANGVLDVTPALAGQAADLYCNQRHNGTGFLLAGQALRLTMPIPSGLFSQDKLIPLPLVNPNEPLTLILTMDTPANVACWTAAPGFGDLTIQNICVNGQLIEVGRDVIDQFRRIQDDFGGQLAVSGQDWEHTAAIVPAATQGEHPVRMPIRKRSMKSLFWTCSSSNYAGVVGAGANDAYSLSYCGSGNIDSYQLKASSVVYPPTAINGWGNTGAAPVVGNQRGECIMELAKAFGSLGWTNPTGYLSNTTYGTNTLAAGGLSNGDNVIGAALVCPGNGDRYNVCPFGLDLEAFQRDALESGLDTETLSQECNLILNVNAITIGPAPAAEDKNINMWVVFDQHYYFNRDGSVTFSN